MFCSPTFSSSQSSPIISPHRPPPTLSSHPLTHPLTRPLTQETHGRLCLCHYNWQSILFACLVMSSKVWDDLSMWNVDFSHVRPCFTLQRINALELAVLGALRYLIKVSAGEYAKYYFLLRSMMTKLGVQGVGTGKTAIGGCSAGVGSGSGSGSGSGCGHGGGGGVDGGLRPLDLAGARRLQLVTESYQARYNDQVSGQRGGDDSKYVSSSSGPGSSCDRSSGRGSRPRSSSVQAANGGGASDSLGGSVHGLCVEQLVHAAHEDADGGTHATPAVARDRALREFVGGGKA